MEKRKYQVMNRKKYAIRRIVRIFFGLILAFIIIYLLSGCAAFDSFRHDMNGSIFGNEYAISFYDNNGNLVSSAHGEKIDINHIVTSERVYDGDSWKTEKTVSGAISIIIDGNEIMSCGSTIIFADSRLVPTVDYNVERIESSANGIGDNTYLAKPVNYYKNLFGKARIIVIQSQLGDPIAVYSGDSVYAEVCSDLPKMTKVMIDGMAMYIHRCNYQIIDVALLN